MLLWPQWHMKQQPQIILHLFCLAHHCFQLCYWNTFCPLQKYCHHLEEESRCLDQEQQTLTTRPDHFTQGRKTPGVRAMLIQCGLRPLLVNVWSKEKEMDKMGLRLAKQLEIRGFWAHIDLSPLHVLPSWRTLREDCIISRQSDYSRMRRVGHRCLVLTHRVSLVNPVPYKDEYITLYLVLKWPNF